ncbi:phosphotransferase family protein [Shouchella lonarensis]|uniref:Thiamine kinase n=1 Tax=Shouchella lonarensis TaxID=1464122 RepID=A0A1G6GGM7_9BACI|nr:phosphotransferase family protein [Shouchella lonarensis]SDB81147.1 Thiamine kinase [Shouchella lonarensis]
MELFLGEGWDVFPAGGATGEAYVAKCGDYQLFIKRNSSPFLAVLSAEGIVPKLLWTKRLESGDVITAQRWIQGRKLKAQEMMGSRTARLLGHIHRSKELLDLCQRMGNQPLTPEIMIRNLREQLQSQPRRDVVLSRALTFLTRTVTEVTSKSYAVCHGDINHNNWLCDEEDNLYLIDWDGTTVADPALDLGLMLYTYIPQSKWRAWLADYGVTLDASLHVRMHWYVVAHTVSEVLWHTCRAQHIDASKLREKLTTLLV